MVLFPFFFLFIHPQEPTAGLGFRFSVGIESAAVPGLATHRPAATASWSGFTLVSGHAMTRGPLILQPKCDPRRFRGSKQYSCRKGRPLGQEGQADLALHERQMTSDCRGMSYAWGVTHTLRDSSQPFSCAGHPSNKLDHQER